LAKSVKADRGQGVAALPKQPPVAGRDTRERILNVAEALFAEHGFDGASMRMITAAAQVNLAAVNYHFGSKEKLIEEVFRRRLVWLNELRRQRLEQLYSEAEKLGKTVRPSRILEAFFGALFDLAKEPGGEHFLRLLGRTLTDPSAFVRRVLAAEYGDVLNRYLDALYTSVPDVPHEEILWRFHFMLGAVSYAIAGVDALQLFAGEPFDDRNLDHLRDRLITFLIGGLRAPLPQFANAVTAAP